MVIVVLYWRSGSRPSYREGGNGIRECRRDVGMLVWFDRSQQQWHNLRTAAISFCFRSSGNERCDLSKSWQQSIWCTHFPSFQVHCFWSPDFEGFRENQGLFLPNTNDSPHKPFSLHPGNDSTGSKLKCSSNYDCNEAPVTL